MKISAIFKAGLFTLLLAFSVTALADTHEAGDTPATVTQPEENSPDVAEMPSTEGTAKEREGETKNVRMLSPPR